MVTYEDKNAASAIKGNVNSTNQETSAFFQLPTYVEINLKKRLHDLKVTKLLPLPYECTLTYPYFAALLGRCVNVHILGMPTTKVSLNLFLQKKEAS